MLPGPRIPRDDCIAAWKGIFPSFNYREKRIGICKTWDQRGWVSYHLHNIEKANAICYGHSLAHFEYNVLHGNAW